MNCRPADRLAWTILADDRSLTSLPSAWHGMNVLDLCRELGSDVFQWSGLGLGPAYYLRNPVRIVPEVEIRAKTLPDGRQKETYRCPGGELCRIDEGYHPIKFLLETPHEIDVFMRMWERCEYGLVDETPLLREMEAEIGDSGILVKALDGTAIPHLLQNLMGMENFYYLLNDCPRQMETLIEFIHQRDVQRFTKAAQEAGTQTLLLIENTSTTFISPSLYERYNLDHVRDFCRIAHAHGKKAVIHMCGHIKNLLPLIRQTELDAIHALTPPPVGDTAYENVLEAWDNRIFFIAAMDPVVLNQGNVEEVTACLNQIYSPGIRRANMILCAFVDGIDIPIAQLRAISKWFRENGATQ